MSDYLEPSSFKKNGFVIVKQVLPSGEVSRLRDKLLGDVRSGFKGAKGIDYVLGVPELCRCQFSSSLVKVLQHIFGDELYYLNDFNLQFNNPNNRGRSGGWHIDANGELGRLEGYLFKKDYRFCKVGIYLQDNSIEFGGGIDVEVGGHKSFRDTHHRYLDLAAYVLDRKVCSMFRHKIRVPLQAGDSVVFDSRLPHASSAARNREGAIPKDKQKITLYWDVAGSVTDAQHFLQNSTIRAINSSETFFTNYLRYYFPLSYPESYIGLANGLSPSVRIFSLDRSKAAFFDQLHKQSVQGMWVEDATNSYEPIVRDSSYPE